MVWNTHNRFDLPTSVSRNASSVIVVVVVVLMAPAPSIEVVLLVLVREAAAAARLGQEEPRFSELESIPERISVAMATRVVVLIVDVDVVVSLTRQPLLD